MGKGGAVAQQGNGAGGRSAGCHRRSRSRITDGAAEKEQEAETHMVSPGLSPSIPIPE